MIKTTPNRYFKISRIYFLPAWPLTNLVQAESGLDDGSKYRLHAGTDWTNYPTRTLADLPKVSNR